MSFPFFKVESRPILIAHRGASGYAPENTLAAFKLALDMGARFVELDVHQTKDGQIVVIHDDNLKKFARVKKKVAQMTVEEIAKVAIDGHWDKRYAHERIPTLEDVLTLIARRAVVDVEIKGSDNLYPGIEEKVLAILERKGYNGMSYISSFNIKRLERARELSSTMHLGYLMGVKPLAVVIKEMRDLRCDALLVSRRQANRTLIQKAHQRGFHVGVYTVNMKSQWDEMATRRVDAIFTDYPDILGLPEYQEPTLGLTNGE